MLAVFGSIVFQVSDDLIHTFKNFSRKEESRWTSHDRVQLKPALEYLGPGIGSVSFDIQLSAALGVNPRKELDQLVRMERSGEVHTFVIGNKPIGVQKWAMRGVSQNWEKLDDKGNVLKASVSITLEEYVR